MAIKKLSVIDFIESIEDCDNIEEIYIETGIREDYIEIRYYDKNEEYKKKSKIVRR